MTCLIPDERERLLWQSRFPAVNADRGKLLPYGYPAAKILARLNLPGSLLWDLQIGTCTNLEVRARRIMHLYCPQGPMRVRRFLQRDGQSCRAARPDARPSGAFSRLELYA